MHVRRMPEWRMTIWLPTICDNELQGRLIVDNSSTYDTVILRTADTLAQLYNTIYQIFFYIITLAR